MNIAKKSFEYTSNIEIDPDQWICVVVYHHRGRRGRGQKGPQLRDEEDQHEDGGTHRECGAMTCRLCEVSRQFSGYDKVSHIVSFVEMFCRFANKNKGEKNRGGK